MQNMQENFNYCRQLVKDYDYDRYLISLCAPKAVQKYIWALLAFNYEISKTREIVTETQLGLIRLQWWREEIDKIYTGQVFKDNQILPALAEAIKEKELSKDSLETLLYAREFDLEDVAPENLEGLVSYADFTNTPLLTLMAQICGHDIDAEVLKHLGCAYGLIGVMRAIPFHATQSRSFLPSSLTMEGLSDQEIVRIVADEAIRNLDIARQERLAQPFRAVSRLVKANARLLRRAQYDPELPVFQKDSHLKALYVLM